MSKDNVISHENPDVLPGLLRSGAKQLIIKAVQAELTEFFAIEDGYRESEQSWAEVLLSLKSRGFRSPKLAVGDGALGFWKAIRKMFSQTRGQRCWVHKTANILNKLPKYCQAKAKQYIHDIWIAEARENVEKAFDLLIQTYQLKYPKAASALKSIEKNFSGLL